jgi:ABC-type uncharacterized transport system permease subunit
VGDDPGLLKVRFGTNEILVSLMLVYVASNLLAWAALGPLRNPEGMGFPGSRNLSQWASSANREILPRTGVHWGVVTALAAVVRGLCGLCAPFLRLRRAPRRPEPPGRGLCRRPPPRGS